MESPIELLAVELIPDAGGPGRFRGGASMRRVYRFTEAEGVLQIRSDRHRAGSGRRADHPRPRRPRALQ